MVTAKPARQDGIFSGSAEYYHSDAIFSLAEAYRKDESPKKVNLGQLAYREEDVLPHTLPCVEEASGVLEENGLSHEHLPILGLRGFRDRVAELVVGKETFESKTKRVSQKKTIINL